VGAIDGCLGDLVGVHRPPGKGCEQRRRVVIGKRVIADRRHRGSGASLAHCPPPLSIASAAIRPSACNSNQSAGRPHRVGHVCSPLAE
jgi:hypothetical protein